jgi:hypothetical protein
MNFVGVFLWLAVGAVALHYWGGYQGEHQYQFVFAERQVTLILFGSEDILMISEKTKIIQF